MRVCVSACVCVCALFVGVCCVVECVYVCACTALRMRRVCVTRIHVMCRQRFGIPVFLCVCSLFAVMLFASWLIVRFVTAAAYSAGCVGHNGLGFVLHGGP